MGTSKTGRYLNTYGTGRSVSDFALVHSNEGKFVRSQTRINGKPAIKLRLDGGGHGQDGMDLLDKYGIEYHITKTYPNGVRVGNVPDHRDPRKRVPGRQAWFPSNWTEKDIRKAGEHVAGLRRNRHTPDGKPMFGVHNGVRVGVIKTNGKIGTVFPDSDQRSVIRKRRKKK